MSVEIENFSISSMVSQSHKRNLPEKIMKTNFKTFFLLEGNQLKMPFHNNDLCGMVQALQLEEHDHPTYIPVPLSSIHLGVRVVNFTAQVEVTQKFVNKEARPIECVYFFPVEEEAAVVNFTTELKGRSIKTQVKEKEVAKEEYRTAFMKRKTAVLLEETKPDIVGTPLPRLWV